MYHCHPPTQIIKTEAQFSVAPEIAEEKMLSTGCFEGFQISPVRDYLHSRIPVW
jgi:homogentisate 1,2-dioxygenase